jgi:glycosyltransferase involved in cell wall biosynthesis
MNSYPLVSILINNYNYDRFLAQAIDSGLNQTYPNVEVIVVDDGSTDSSLDVIGSYRDRVSPVVKGNGGQASALNSGFSVCKGEIICLLDADDLFLPERVAEVVRLFQLSTNIDWVFTESAPIETEYLQDENLALVYKNVLDKSSQVLPRKIDFREDIKNGNLPNFAPSTSNLCFSRQLLEKIFPLPEIKGFSGMAITDLYVKLLAVGLGTGYVTVQDLGVFRLHNNLYSTLDLNRQRRFFGEIHTTTGYWIKINFPELLKISVKLISKGYATYLKSDYLMGKSSDADCEKMIRCYLSKISLPEKLKVYLVIAYYSLKLTFQDVV